MRAFVVVWLSLASAACGRTAPIYVAKRVFEEGGISKDEILRQLAPNTGGPTT